MTPRPSSAWFWFRLWMVAAAVGCVSSARAEPVELGPFQPNEISIDGKKVPCGSVETVAGKFGGATSFRFVDGAAGGFMTARLRPTPHWDHSDGFSFWVKGDGSKHWGGIELIDRDDFRLRYGYCFPIDSAEWKKIVVPWREVIPELDGPLIDAERGYAPSHFGNFWFGKWFYWREYPAESFAIEKVTLEPKIELPPAPKTPPGLERIAAKLRGHKPVTIVTMGDSLTDPRHWSNRETRWPEFFAKAIKSTYGSEVTVINPAIGGTTLSQNMVLMPRWSAEAPAPDLVTIWFGGNDWETGVRGERFGQYMRLAVDRVRRQTNGGADIVLMTPCPSFDRWDTMKELEQATREVARETGVAVVDEAEAFRKAGSPAEAMKRTYWAWDKVHLGKGGQELAAEEIIRAISNVAAIPR